MKLPAVIVEFLEPVRLSSLIIVARKEPDTGRVPGR